MLPEIEKLRRELHKYPELSGHEVCTAKRIKEFISTHNDTEIIDEIGGHGLAAIYSYPNAGPTIMIRCELDALPIDEYNTFDYKSTKQGISHKCGHDGHMAMVAGLVLWLRDQSFDSGTVILLFQPAEETGKGAYKILNDKKFKDIHIDYAFALHNLPGEPLNSIVALNNYFSATVQSLVIQLAGKESHAAEPENGNNPSLGVAEIIHKLSNLNIIDPHQESFAILTPVHINMGEKAYGVSPGYGEVHYTLRTWSETEMDQLKENVQSILSELCEKYQLELELDWLEYFPAVKNDKKCNEFILNAAKLKKLKIIERSFPLKFGEDFGWFSKQCKAAMFGLGSGLESPALHHADYDFPDEIIPTGMSMFQEIITQLLTDKH